jgi:hypothetical protein
MQSASGSRRGGRAVAGVLTVFAVLLLLILMHSAGA